MEQNRKISNGNPTGKSAQEDPTLHHGHRARMRERYALSSIESFQEHEILEMLLFYVIPKRNTNPLAHVLINQFGSIRGVLDAEIHDLKSVEGVGESTAIFLNFIGSLFKVYMHKKIDTPCLEQYEDRYAFFLNELKYETTKEILMVVCLDDMMCVKSYAKIEKGSSNEVHFDMKTVTRFILNSNCTDVIISHNHPMGPETPSYTDVQSTRYMQQSLEGIGIRLVDHIVVGNGKAYSMDEQCVI